MAWPGRLCIYVYTHPSTLLLCLAACVCLAGHFAISHLSQVIEDVDEEGAMVFYLMYVKLEEKHGLIRHIMSILDRATNAVAEKDKYVMFLFYINKVCNTVALH